MKYASQTGSKQDRTWPAKTLIALGIVYGDIGTSPLYAMRECFRAKSVAIDAANVCGVLSLIFWSLTIVISLKYLLLVMRADNHGEGGILALALLARKERGKSFGFAMLMGLFGAGLLYGDGLITPAISVLSAVEGLEISMPSLATWIVPISIAILVGLFALQPFGTAKVGRIFGPVMLVWFLVIGFLGVRGILLHPDILVALSPLYVIGRTRLIKNPQKKIRSLRRLLFQLLHRNSGDPIERFLLPTDDVVEVGERVVI